MKPSVGATISKDDARRLPAKNHEIEKLVRDLNGRWKVRRPGATITAEGIDA